MSFITTYTHSIVELCKQYKVKSLYAFGSATTPAFTNKSDVDLLVEFEEQDPFDYADNYFNLKFHLQDLLKRQVDLLENKSLKNPFLINQINSTKVSVYGK
jgi:predicted nucleotidyltransferase